LEVTLSSSATDPKTTYRLGSNEAVYAPGIVNWAMSGYWHKPDRKTLEKVISDGWKIPVEAARALLSKAVKYELDGETVVFTVDA
jgi:hypothetical protein